MVAQKGWLTWWYREGLTRWFWKRCRQGSSEKISQCGSEIVADRVVQKKSYRVVQKMLLIG